ncbi:DUF5058 family protein [Acetonema longum]|uniref:DUF5058 family protein n=1 Tax=Acetonema longum DSM 6540 TaxID=1009370 RepID=F7NKP3_9FIRM|nr:DUF5058 family protein [Acetonema longum]EGO63347.1 hypothetical protein ALO_13309 [Acetonema longum DSM 6540]
MDLNTIINSPGMWLASSVMVIVILVQSIVFLREAFQAADRLNMPRKQCYAGMRSAMITALGPAFAPVIVLLALIAVVGAPTAWMRLNDIGAARTELAIVTLASKVIGVDPQSAAFNLKAYTYSLWGMALNNMGWMLVALLFTHKMSGMVTKLNQKYDPKWMKYLMTGATVGLFAFLLSGQLIGAKADKWYAAFIAAACMLCISKLFRKHQRLQELALGISMLVGMMLATAIV